MNTIFGRQLGPRQSKRPESTYTETVPLAEHCGSRYLRLSALEGGDVRSVTEVADGVGEGCVSV